MWTYIARRLLLMVVTLFGITLVTFGIMLLTPGDPTSLAVSQESKSSLKKEDLKQLREFYNLDKPAFVNFSPEHRAARFAELIAKFDDDEVESRSDGRRTLRSQGAAGLEAAFATLERALAAEAAGEQRAVSTEIAKSGEPRDKLSAHVLSILPAMARGLEGAPGEGADAAAWQAWWKARGAELTPAAGEAAVSRWLGDGGEPEALLASHGTLATLPLLTALRATQEREARHRLMRALSLINEKPWEVVLTSELTLDSEAAARQLDDNQRFWKRWGGREASLFYDLSTAGWLHGMVSETQYGTWIGSLLQGDLGDSFEMRRPVLEVIRPKLWVTTQLSILSIILAYLIAIPMGIYSAARPYSTLDTVATVVTFTLYSLPSFWVGQLMISYLTGGGLFPYQSNKLAMAGLGWGEWAQQLVLPLICMTYGSFAYISRLMRSGMLEVVRADYIRTARAKGLSEATIIFKHALRNSLIPVLTIMANILPALIGGSVIIEQIFGIDGMGRLAFQSVFSRDYPVVMAIAFFSAVMTLIGILLSDLSYALVDPRISYK